MCVARCPNWLPCIDDLTAVRVGYVNGSLLTIALPTHQPMAPSPLPSFTQDAWQLHKCGGMMVRLNHAAQAAGVVLALMVGTWMPAAAQETVETPSEELIIEYFVTAEETPVATEEGDQDDGAAHTPDEHVTGDDLVEDGAHQAVGDESTETVQADAANLPDTAAAESTAGNALDLQEAEARAVAASTGEHGGEHDAQHDAQHASAADHTLLEGELPDQHAAQENVATTDPTAASVASSDGENQMAWQRLSPGYRSPSPLPVSGKAMYYNPDVMQRVIATREGFGHIGECATCIGYVAMLRAGDLDRTVWLQIGPTRVEGPFQVVDVAAPKHVGMLQERGWIVDVDYETAERWQFRMPYVTVWERPPLDLLLAADALPLGWDATMMPAPTFSFSPHSAALPDGTVDHAFHAKQALAVRHTSDVAYVDTITDVPENLFVR